METSSKRGKIPQKDWPSIIKRYEAGETLAAIARTYDCSPPAISYILSRSRARDGFVNRTAPEVNDAAQSGQLKPPASAPSPSQTERTAEEIRIASADVVARTSIPVEVRDPEPLQIEPPRAINGQEEAADAGIGFASPTPSVLPTRQEESPQPFAQPAFEEAGNSNPGSVGALPKRGEPRGTLHLQLAQQGGHRADLQPHDTGGSNASESPDVRPAGGQPGIPFTGTVRGQFDHSAGTNYGVSVRQAAEANRPTDGSAFIDRVLRQRVDEDITAFLAAFDAALADDSQESRAALRQATDRLLRAGARTRIELERLEARLPLPPREAGGRQGTAWRPR